ncbi:hypothetical protein [Cytobacillus praedii]|uniref:hypothetical protein n=1 Tax=Cytobacillus praedii TaxID=1742358 RepID=UPI002E219165|nr:hypothetical protein [Cytobacillus praedii]
MSKTITFSFRSSKYEGTEAKETFTFENLGIEEDMADNLLKVEIDNLFQAWVWDKLNISYSIVIDEENAYSSDDSQ